MAFAVLETLDDCWYGVALGGEFLLGHLVGFLVPAFLDNICDIGADLFGLHRTFIVPVDHCHALAITTE